MALIQHSNEQVRYQQQIDNTTRYVIPFIEETKKLHPGSTVMEIGTGEGGVLKPFADRGCICTGVDLDCPRVEIAVRLHPEEIANGSMEFLCQNVYDDDFHKKYAGHFDLIVLKDTIEHIPHQEKFIPYLKGFLKPGGQIFFGFPPWYMPFGGHQQIGMNRITMLPYYHILPMPLYKTMLRLFGEKPGVIDQLVDIKQTQLSIERFERILRKSRLQVSNKQHYLINPIYRYKFGLKPVRQLRLIEVLPYVRNFFTTCVYYTVSLR